MISALFRRRVQVSAPAVPEDLRVYAIGDIHGRADLFDALLTAIEEDHAAREPRRLIIITLGDLVDRGPDSAGVVDRAIALAAAQPDARFIAGNHEELLLRAHGGDAEAVRLFARVGGRETMLSYGVTPTSYDRADFDELRALMQARIPPSHIAFFEAMEDLIEIGDYAFVHAGIRPGIPLDAQRPAHLRWIRAEFLEHRAAHPRFIIHGHTVTDLVDERSNRIGIDTGAYATGRLTAIGLEGTERWFIST